jgi:hypothetical protein
LGHFCSYGKVFEEESRLYGVPEKKPSSHAKNGRCWKKSCRTLYKTEKVGIIKVDGFGLFSVPAPPFHFPVSGGVFLFLARQYNHVLVAFALRASDSMPSKIWSIDGARAKLELPGLRAHVDAAQPTHGLNELTVCGDPCGELRLLGVSGPALTDARCIDWHVRGDDLNASYEIGPPIAAQVDISWKALALQNNEDLFALIDLLVSVRTERLDWRHDVSIEGKLPATLAWHEQSNIAGCVDFCSERWIYSELVHPADLRGDEVRVDPAKRVPTYVRRHLFPSESLEKGVILRARARGLFLSPATALASVEACYTEFLRADPPLSV